MPLIDSVSCVCAERSARRSCWRVSRRRWAAAARRVGQMNSGSAARPRSVNRQSRKDIRTIVLTTVMTLDKQRAVRVRDCVLDGVYVVREAGEDLTAAGGREEAQRHLLEAGVEAVTYVLHHALADDVAQPALDHADQRPASVATMMPATSKLACEPSPSGIAVVNDRADQQRRHEANQARRSDADRQQRDLRPVFREQPDRAAQRWAGRPGRPTVV